MESAKVIVCSAVLKRNTTFRANEIVEETSLSRQLVYKHLMALVDTGAVEKRAEIYYSVDKDKILSIIIGASTRIEPTRGFVTAFLPPNVLENLQNLTVYILRLRSLDAQDSLAIKQAVLEEFDKTIQSLRQERKYLANGNLSAKGSANWFWKNRNVEEVVKFVRDATGALTRFTCSESEMSSRVWDLVSKEREE